MYALFVTLVFIATATLPWWLARLSGRPPKSGLLWLPALAGLLFVVAGLLPDIHISHQTNSFQEHFVGGGFYTTLLYVYVKRLFSWRLPGALDWLALFAWTSAFGVANELFEFAVTQLNLTHINITDTSWDLVANTAGAFVCYSFMWLAKQTALVS